MVSPGHALPHRAPEEDRPLTASAPRVDPQLFPRSKAALQRPRRGPEQQGQSHYEKILWLPNLPGTGSRSLSLTWQAPRPRINPRVFLTNPKQRGRTFRSEPLVLPSYEVITVVRDARITVYRKVNAPVASTL